MEDNKEMERDKKNGSNNEAKETVDEKPFHYKHARANIAVDVVVFGVLPDKDELHVFVQRDKKEHKWSLPGRFMHCGTNPNDEIASDDNWNLEKTREKALCMTWPIITTLYGEVVSNSESYTIKENDDLICQLEAMSEVGRDSRPERVRVVSIPYMTLVWVKKDEMPSEHINNEKVSVAQWMPLSELINNNGTRGKIELDHDHFKILDNGLTRLFQEARTRPVGKKMLPNEFDISNLIHIYKVILQAMGVSVERSNLRKLLIERGVIKEVNNENSSGKGVGTYRFVDDKYKEYKRYLNFGFNPKPRGDKSA